MRIIGNERGFFIPLTLTVIGVAPIEIALIAALHIKSFGLIFFIFQVVAYGFIYNELHG